MKNELVNYLLKFVSLSEDEATFLNENVPVLTFKKGKILLREGDIADKCWFVLKGCVREFQNEDGLEKTTYFYTEEHAIVPAESFEKQQPYGYNLVCTEETILTESNLSSIPDSFEQFPKFEKISLILSGKYHKETKDLFATFITSSPEERYLHLLKTRPKLLQRVPQHQIASFLGVTPESLSRIRNRLSIR
jgi:CRP-like cAMP-binding protein